MDTDSKNKNFIGKRAEPRRTRLRNHRIEIKLIGEPIYQFRVMDISSKGAGILIKEDSKFLNIIEVNQTIDVDFISPKGAAPSGCYKAKIKHITKLGKKGPAGNCLVGINLLQKMDQGE